MSELNRLNVVKEKLKELETDYDLPLTISQKALLNKCGKLVNSIMKFQNRQDICEDYGIELTEVREGDYNDW